MPTMDEPSNEDKPTEETAAEATAKSDPKKEKTDQPKKKLTPEEQMAAFEKAMKEEDWGHQPC